MIDPMKMVTLALSEVGYHEKASNAFLEDKYANAGSGNWTKYGAHLDSIEGWYNGKKNGYEWCNQFTDDMCVIAYGVKYALPLLCRPLYSAGAGCKYSAQYFKNYGRWFTSPKVGDMIYFDYGSGINHIGIVVEVNSVAIITVEGNVDGQVKKCSYPHSSSVIAGYGRPCWELFTEEESDQAEPTTPVADTAEVTVTLPIIKYGDEGLYVKVMQTMLIGKGYSCGIYGADGEYGMQTKIGLYEFQKANSINTDCVCDAITWTKLLNN